MAKQNAKQQPPSPERYIREKVRKLPICKCYKGTTFVEDREMSIVVIRQHTGGTFTVGAYMLDRWCVGVKYALWYFSISKADLDRLIERFENSIDKWEEVDYVEAHNWVYGALDWATNAGISPCKDFAIARYILEEDDDNVELRDYEFGKDGEYYLLVENTQELNKYLPTLKKTLGEGNFFTEVCQEDDYDDFDDDEDDDDDEEDDSPYPWADVPEMEYTYVGGNYPKRIQLHHPEIEPILRKSVLELEEKDIDTVLALPVDTLREDLHQLILREIGRQYGKTEKQLEEEEQNEDIIGNCFIFLSKVGTLQDTLPVLLEFLRQSPDIIFYNEGFAGRFLVKPLVYNFLREDPTCFKSFLLEKGLCSMAKTEILDFIRAIVCDIPSLRQPVLDMMHEVLEAYKADLPIRTLCDGEVVAFALFVVAELSATEFLPLVEEFYATDLVDKGLMGEIDAVRDIFNAPISADKLTLPYGDIYAIFEIFKETVR